MVAVVTFPSPGFLGLNKQKDQGVLGPEWATLASNCVVDSQGRLASRKGWESQTPVAVGDGSRFDTVHEYVKSNATTTLVAVGGSKIWESSDDGANWTERTGALTVTSDHWQFVNFNSKVIGACVSHSLAVKTSGNFATITAASGSVPTSPVAVLAAFGRVWAISSDYQTLKYSALLDETRWHADDGGGSIDLSQVWTQGTDTGVALAAFGGRLFVFGKRHILVWSDGQGSEIGLSPTNMYIEDVIENAGCVARDSIARIGEGDIVFLSPNGIRSLTRVLQEKQTPINDLTRNSLDYFNGLLLSGDLTKVRAAYSPANAFYLLSHPDAQTTVYFDMRQPLQDGSYRAFEWPDFTPGGLCARINGDVLFGFDGVVGKYSGYRDDDQPYTVTFRSGWLDLEEDNNFAKFLKRLKLVAAVPVGASPTVSWGWDFAPTFRSFTLSPTSSVGYGWGSGKWGVALWGGTSSYRITNIPASGSGQFFRLQVQVEIDGFAFAIQSITAYYEKGRFA